MNPVPELHLQPDSTARYELVDEVLAVTKQAHVQKMGFVGNEYYMKISRPFFLEMRAVPRAALFLMHRRQGGPLRRPCRS